MTTREMLAAFHGLKIVCVGDMMLDRFVYGDVERISPEAPVPVLKWTSEREVLGGVGNVAANLAALGAGACVVSRAGADPARERIEQMLRSLGAGSTLVHSPGVPTTLKTRFVSKHSHLLRLDREEVAALDAAGEAAALAAVAAALDAGASLVVASDYAKGFLTPSLLSRLAALCKEKGVKMLVDPKGTDYARYTGASLVKPNRKELELASGRRLDPAAPGFIECVVDAARSLLKASGIGNALVTLSERGMVFVPGDGSDTIYLPTECREVYDVSGAGDTTIAALAAALAAGAAMDEAMALANAAAGIVVGKVGTSTVSPQELLSRSSGAGKIMPLGELAAHVRRWQAEGLAVGFTNGCFDCLHSGHLFSLARAKEHCDRLVVAVNSDSSVRRLKGPTRPIQDEKTRSAVLAALEDVDAVTIFGDATAMHVVEALRPDVIAKEGYALKDWPEARFVESCGGRAVTLPRLEGYSTSALERKMNAAAQTAQAAQVAPEGV